MLGGNAMWDVVVALAIVLAAIALLRLAVVFAPSFGRKRSLRVVESLPLGPRQRLHVVEYGKERLLVGATDASLSLLRELPPPDPAEAPSESDEEDVRPRPLPSLRSFIRALGIAGAFAVALLAAPDAARAQTDLAALLDVQDATSPERIASTLEVVALLTLISIAPSLLLMATCFTRIVIVLSLLRQAMGINQLPPNQVLVGLALFMTLFVMTPIGATVHEQALTPYMEREIEAGVAATRALEPIRAFLLTHTREKDLSLFLSFATDEADEVAAPEDVPLRVLLPSYMISELRTAFEIGFTVFLPFLIIDIVIASMLISMGMIVLPPIVISLPFKLMLFVLLDGWSLIVGALMKGLM